MTGAPPRVPLRRNRDFVLLQAGQLLSTTGTQSATVAYPLLVLAVTGSPALAGLVTFARILPGVLFSLLGGVAADRFERKPLLIASDAVRAAAVGGLAGPPLGGALFGLGRALPFVADAASYAFSVVSFLLMRTPFQEARAAGGTRVRAELAEGWRFLWGQPFLRATTFLYGLTNFVGPGVLLAIVVVGDRQGLSGGEIGALLAAFSVCLLVGSFASGLARRVLSVRAILLLELWAWPGPLLFVAWPDAYVLAASILPAALAIPVTDSVVVGYRLAITPDRLVGRVESVRSNIALALAPFGSLTAGLLLSATSARLAVLVFAAVGLLLALWGALSPTLRAAPRLADLAASPRSGTPSSRSTGTSRDR